MSAPGCSYNLPADVWCPAAPFCNCVQDPEPKPLPDPAQTDIFDFLEE